MRLEHLLSEENSEGRGFFGAARPQAKQTREHLLSEEKEEEKQVLEPSLGFALLVCNSVSV